MCDSISSSDRASSSSSKSASPTRAVGTAPTTPEPPPPPADNFTPGQRNAIAKAKSYLDYSAFSKKGLIEQLEYSQFSTADATFAVQHLESTGAVDWNEQAVKKAKSYLDYSSFSLQGLVEQLEYSGFTPSQAQYGATTAYGG